MFGFYRTAAAVPQIRVADIAFNLGEIKKLVSEAEKKTVSLIVFPELSITGYTCGDLFLQETVLSGVASALLDLAKFAEKKKASIVVGAPLPFRNGLYNCAVVINNGKIKGIVPKSHIPNYREFYEKRWFLPGRDIRNEKMKLGDFNVPFGTKLIFEHNRHFRFAIEICEDLWNVVPPSSYHSAAGALIMANLSASDELVSKSAYRRELVRDQSARCVAGYIYTSSGVWESSTDLVFGGHAMISENGAIISENSRFSRKSDIIFADIDCQKLAALRTAESSFGDCPAPEGYETIRIDTVADLIVQILEITVYLIALPFLFLIIDSSLFIVVGLTVISIVITSYIFSNYIKRIYLFNRRMYTNFEKQLVLIFQNVGLIREYNLKKTIDNEIGVQNYKINELALRRATIIRSNKLINRTIYMFSSFFYRIIAVGLVFSGKMSIGDFFAYNMILQLLFSPIEMLTSLIKPVKELVVNSERTVEFLSKEEQHNGNLEMPLSGKLEVKDLCFYYDDATNFLIKNFNYTFDIGKLYGVVGYNGCGKSTLLTLLARLNDPKEGAIYFGGAPIQEIKKDVYHSKVSYIDSAGFVFPTTFQKNIVCNAEYQDDKFNNIVNELNVEKLKNQFPKNNKFFSVGRSTSLSNGECQKICIARAMYNDKKIYLFDEAFSYLDFYSKMNILETIRKNLSDSIVIVVSHDITVIRKLDYVLYLENGVLAETGTPKDLFQNGEMFSKLFCETV